MAQQLLRGYGYQVLEAASGEEAVQLMERHRGTVHLLLTDVVMPRMNGHEVGKMLTGRHPGLKVLYMSGYSRDEMAQHVLLDRDAPFIQKPFTPQMMAESVRRALDRKSEPAFWAPGHESLFVESLNACPN